MALPVSTQFNVFDWNSRYLLTEDGSKSFSVPGYLLTDNADVVGAYDTSGGFFSLAALAEKQKTPVEVVSYAKIPVSIEDEFTLEFDVYFNDSLPAGVNTVGAEATAVVGIVTSNGGSLFFGFSKSGISAGTHSSLSDASLLAGSKRYIVDSSGAIKDGATIRVVCSDGTTAAVYVNDVAASYATDANYLDAELRYNVTVGSIDSTEGYILLRCSGLSASLRRKSDLKNVVGDSVIFTLGSLRLSDVASTPEVPPVAKAICVSQAKVQAPVQLFSTGSYDSLARELSYLWEVTVRPEGSAAFLQGYSFSSTTLTSSGSDVIELSFLTPSRAFDGYEVVVSADKAAAAISLSIDDVEKKIHVYLETDEFGVPVSTGSDLIVALSDAASPSYNPAISGGELKFAAEVVSYEQKLTYTLLDDTLVTDVLDVGTFTFSGGSGSQQTNPFFVPDKTGVYVFSLVVNNGVRDSLPSKAFVYADVTKQLIGHKPNTEFVFNYLSDFWNIVKDRKQLESFWSATTQIVGAEMISLWQNDFSKSLRDVSRTYQKRWLLFKPYFDFAENSISATFVDVPAASHINSVSPGSSASSLTIDSYDCAVLADETPILLKTSLGSPVVGYSSTVSNTADNEWRVTFVSELATSAVLFTSTSGTVVADPLTPELLVSTYLYDPAYALSKDSPSSEIVGSWVTINTGSTLSYRQITDVAGNYFRVSGAALPIDGRRLTWSHLACSSFVELQQSPYFSVVCGRDVKLGDVLRLEFVHPEVGAKETALVPVLAYDGKTLLVDWSNLLSAANLISLSLGNNTFYTFSDIAGMQVSAVGVYTTVPAVDDLVSVPLLGETPSKHDYVENYDFSVRDGVVEFADLAHGEVYVNPDGRTLTFGGALGAGVESLETSGARCVIVTAGYPGVFGIEAISGSTITLDRALPVDDITAIVRLPRWDYIAPAPVKLWSEISYFDNWRSIENNFGLMLGFPKSVVTSFTDSADYLSVIKAMHFSFMHGPTLGNLKLAAQAIFSLPYTDVAGQIVNIIEPTETQDGVIVFIDSAKQQRTFAYPVGTTLAANPTTGRTLGAYEYVADQSSVPANELEAYLDSIVPEFTSFIDAIDVDDYISDAAVDARFSLGLRKYHTFVVKVPLNKVSPSSALGLVKEFLLEAKPAHTNFILLGYIALEDDIVVEEQFRTTARLHLCDTPVSSLSYDVDDDICWPSEKTIERWDDATNEDVLEKYESGFCAGVADDFSGDGSWNGARRELDMVNSADSDIDVNRSYLWVPVIKDTADEQAELEFLVGETVSLTRDDAVIEDSVWNTSPAVVMHIGAGSHPRLPFGIRSPQNTHPYTYLLLGFDVPIPVTTPEEAGAFVYSVSSSGVEERLDAIETATLLDTTLRVVGGASGATAIVSPEFPPVRSDDLYGLFFLETLCRADKLQDFCPLDTLKLSLRTYVGFGGITIAATEALSDTMAADNSQRQVQHIPYDSTLADNEQFVPSFGPGLYTQWSDADPGELMSWGYIFDDSIYNNPTDIDAFSRFQGGPWLM